MNSRSFFVGGVLLLLLLTNDAFAGGKYQRTKDGKTRVWNNYPEPGDAATWSGERDADKFATGNGTLTWYLPQRKYATGSSLPSIVHTASIRYTGNMVRGKLDGPVVNMDENGATFHGKFVDGHRVGEWAAGPGPSSSRAVVADQQSKEPDQPKIVAKEAETAPRPTPSEQPATAAMPAAAPKPTPAPVQKIERPVAKSAVKEKANADVDDSLRALVGPPPLLRTEDARSGLTAGEVIELADKAARAQGYDLGAYQRPQLQFAAATNIWSVSYDQKHDAGEAGKPINIKIDDQTKKTSIVTGNN